MGVVECCVVATALGPSGIVRSFTEAVEPVSLFASPFSRERVG